MSNIDKDEKYRKIHFAVMAIEGSAKRLNISGQRMYNRLNKQNLIKDRLIKHYELLHTQSLNWVIDDTIETLKNWEKEEKSIKKTNINDKTISRNASACSKSFGKNRKEKS